MNGDHGIAFEFCIYEKVLCQLHIEIFTKRKVCYLKKYHANIFVAY